MRAASMLHVILIMILACGGVSLQSQTEAESHDGKQSRSPGDNIKPPFNMRHITLRKADLTMLQELKDFYDATKADEPHSDPGNVTEIRPTLLDVKALKLFTACTEAQKASITEAFLDMGDIIYPFVKDWRRYKIDWTSRAAIDYFGPPAYTRKYRHTILWNIAHVAGSLDPVDPWENTVVRCDDPYDACDDETYAYVYVGDDRTRLHIFFCPLSFIAPSFKKLLSAIEGSDNPLVKALNMKWWTETLAHPDVVAVAPKAPNRRYMVTDLNLRIHGHPEEDWEVAYGCAKAKSLASGLTVPLWHPVEPSSNAENYSCYIIARWVQQRFGRYPYNPPLSLPHVKHWPYRRSHDTISLATGPILGANVTAEEQRSAEEACKRATSVEIITGGTNGTGEVKATVGFDVTPEMCENASFNFAN